MWYIHTTESYSAIKRNSVLMRLMNLEPIIQSEVSQKEKDKYHILMHMYGIQKNVADETSKEWTCGYNRRRRGWDELKKQH